MMQFHEAIVIIICLTAVFAYITERFTKWPTVIGVTVFSLMGSLMLVFAGKLMPQVEHGAMALAATINFPVLLMKVMLGFLLFAGSIQMSERELKKERVAITVLSTICTPDFRISGRHPGVSDIAASGLHVDYMYCLLFGAIVSPTDPIAVLSILRHTGIPKLLEVKYPAKACLMTG